MEYLFAYICTVKPKDPEKIKHLYAATLRLVNTHGLTGLTMAMIGKQAGLGMGTLYVYFKSKEDLINSLFRELKSQNTRRIYQDFQDGLGFKPALKGLVTAYLQNRWKHFHEHVFIEQCLHSHFLDDDSRKLDEAAYQGFFELLNKGKSELLIKPFDNTLLTGFLIGGANELVNQLVQQRKKPNQAFYDQCFQLCWDSLKT